MNVYGNDDRRRILLNNIMIAIAIRLLAAEKKSAWDVKKWARLKEHSSQTYAML